MDDLTETLRQAIITCGATDIAIATAAGISVHQVAAIRHQVDS